MRTRSENGLCSALRGITQTAVIAELAEEESNRGRARVAGWLFADSTLVIAMKKPQVAASPLTTHGGTFTIRIPLQQLHRQRQSEDLDVKGTQGKRDAS